MLGKAQLLKVSWTHGANTRPVHPYSPFYVLHQASLVGPASWPPSLAPTREAGRDSWWISYGCLVLPT